VPEASTNSRMVNLRHPRHAYAKHTHTCIAVEAIFSELGRKMPGSMSRLNFWRVSRSCANCSLSFGAFGVGEASRLRAASAAAAAREDSASAVRRISGD
jgi:hypothetical protein